MNTYGIRLAALALIPMLAMASPQGQAAGSVLQQLTAGRMTLLVAEHREDSLENIRKQSSR